MWGLLSGAGLQEVSADLHANQHQPAFPHHADRVAQGSTRPPPPPLMLPVQQTT